MNLGTYFKDDFKSDFFSSIVVFLVAIPLCLGIAIASGMPPEAGLISGIIGGIVVGSLTGCSLQASGPAAGLVAIVFEIIQEHGIERLGAIILFAGILQIIVGVLRLGVWFRAVSPPVVHGMLAGIGVLIFASQFHVMVDDIPQVSGIQNILSLPGAVYKGIIPLDSSSHHLAALVGVITICVIVFWNFALKRFFKVVPAALVGVLVAVILSSIMQYPIKYVSIPENIFGTIQFPTLQCFNCLLEWEVLIESLTVAFIASAETLLTSTAIGKMRPSLSINYNKEIIAQGVGNSLAGFLGVLPITGVIVRSAANVSAGAKTKASTIFHGIWILLFVLYLFPLLEYIPVASLAAVLVYTGYKLIDLNAIKDLSKVSQWEVLIYFATLIVIVMTSLLEGILVGIVLSIIKLLYDFSRLDIREEHEDENKIHIYINGNATFINLPKFADALEKIPARKEINIHFEDLAHLDHSSLELLVSWEKKYTSTGGTVSIRWNELEAKFNQSKQATKV